MEAVVVWENPAFRVQSERMLHMLTVEFDSANIFRVHAVDYLLSMLAYVQG